MAESANYDAMTLDDVIILCQREGIETLRKTKTVLIQDLCALRETDADSVSSEQTAPAQPSVNIGTGPNGLSNAAPVTQPEHHGPGLFLGGNPPLLRTMREQLSCSNPELYLQLLREEREAAERKAEREAERAERQAEAERAEREAARRHELEMAKLQLRQADQPSTVAGEAPLLPRAKFPVMEENCDIDAFLVSFEKVCRGHDLPESQWGKYLIPGLKGKAQQAHSKLPPEWDNDYQAIKEAILKKYQLTPEIYRRKFRGMELGSADSYADVMTELCAAYDQWTDPLTDDTRASLRTLMILEQFYDMLPTKVRKYVVNRKPASVTEAGDFADEYKAQEMPERRNPVAERWRKEKPSTTPPAPAKPSSQRPAPGAPGYKPASRDARKCYACGKPGHLSNACPEKKKSAPPGKPASNPSSVLLVSGKAQSNTDNQQAVTVGNLCTTGFRDTGAEVTLVRPELVNAEDLIPGKTLSITGVGGMSPNVPLARVFLDWGAGSGVREVGVSAEIPTSVLLGRDLGRLISCYVPAESTENPQIPADRPEHTEVLCKAVCVTPDQLGDGQREVGSGVCGSSSPRKGDAENVTDVCMQVNDLCISNAENVKSDCDNGIVPVLAVTRRAARAEAALSLREEPAEVSPSVCSDPVDSAASQPQQLSLFATGQLAGTGSAAFEKALRDDQSLEQLKELAASTPTEGDKYRVYWDNGKLYKQETPRGDNRAESLRRQLIVPAQFRGQLLQVAHEIPLAGHLGVSRTKSRLMQNFYWPGVGKDIAGYCRSCITCQRVGKTGDIHKVPLNPLPIIDEPFKRVAVDIIGPLAIPSSSGKRFILTVVDYATRYPEAVALSSIRADKVADALLGIFTRVGFPAELLSDQGPQFMSDLMQGLCRKIEVNHIVASPYHPQTNGLCERFNGTLKQMLRTFVESQGKDWERYLPHLLFAYREVPQESTGFSPFELLYGRRVRGPLDLIRESWEGKRTGSEVSVVDYVLRFRDKMETLVGMVKENMAQAQSKQKQWYDRNARERTYQEGQKVYVLLPMRQNKLQAAWEGPYPIVKCLNKVNYVVSLGEGGRRQKTFHVNMLKEHHERSAHVMPVCSLPEREEADPLLDLLSDSRELGADLNINSHLSPQQRSQLVEVLTAHHNTFTGKPGRTHLAVHHVDTGTHTPTKQSSYRVSLEVQADIRKEIEEMLQLAVIQKSHSAWASPVVLVPKKDQTTRFCVDYRKLNAITTSDAYPMPRIDELLDKLAGASYLTIMDLSRGYWQIPLTPEAQEKSAFITPFGLYEFTVMPFGMKNAPATFQRLVNDLLEGLETCAVAYLDDIAVFSPTWEEHLVHLSQVLDKLAAAGLTVKPSKCQLGMSEVQYLGHRVGGGTLRPETEKVEAIVKWPTPLTKKQVMSFLGTAGYYRKFIQNYSALAKPLTDLTKKKLPRMVTWTPECAQAFQALKDALSSAPVLQAPDFTRKFVVQTDASAFGLGAVLSQVNQEGEEHPILYLSRKLLPRESLYSTIEKECLAIVWSLQKLQHYLYGRHFTVITDHNPLSWLNRVAGENSKLLRWSLILQQYDFTIQHKKGSEHGNADGLSRQAESEDIKSAAIEKTCGLFLAPS